MGVETKILISDFLIFLEGCAYRYLPKISYVQKENQSKHSSLQERKMKSDVV